jgi:hypothetical protein
MLVQIARDIENNDIIALSSAASAAVRNEQFQTMLRTLGLTLGGEAALIATIVNNSAQALSVLILELVAPLKKSC